MIVGMVRVLLHVRVCFLMKHSPFRAQAMQMCVRYYVHEGQLLVDDMPLVQPEKFVGYTGNAKAPDTVLLKNNGLHVQLIFDRAHAIGARDQAGLADVVMESALSVIMDLGRFCGMRRCC
jgi:malate synthase